MGEKEKVKVKKSKGIFSQDFKVVQYFFVRSVKSL